MEAYAKHINSDNSGVFIIEFFHPKGNSLPSVLLSKIEGLIYEAGNDNCVKTILIRSFGDGAFCAGASFDELLEIEDKNSAEQFFKGFANVINAIRKVGKIVVGEVQGKTVGGGVGMAAAFDYCFATKTSSIKLSELSLGIGPFVIAPAIDRKMGISTLSELTINSKEWRTSLWAKEKGLFYEVLDNKEEMQMASSVLLNSLSEYSLEAITEIKKTLWKGCENWDILLSENAKISGKLVLSEFTKNKLKEFKG